MTYLSFVMTSRNDNYGGKLIPRMENSLESIIKFSEKFGLESEIVLVEWNPPEEKASLKEEINWPEIPEEVDIKLITVPPEMHNSLPNSEEMPIFEYIAKNTGIRRSNGEFILATNPDIIYSPEIIRYFESEELSSDKYYRIDRRDIRGVPDTNLSIESKIRYCEKNTYAVQTKYGEYNFEKISEEWTEYLEHLLVIGRKKFKSAYNKIISKSVLDDPISILDLHTHCSGDFLLASRKKWMDLKGYPELNVSWHIDRLGTLNFAASGLEEKILVEPLHIYHQEHENMHAQRPQPSREEILGDSKEMLKKGKIKNSNGQDWGLNQEKLEIEIIG